MISLGLFLLFSPSFHDPVRCPTPPFDLLRSSQELITPRHESKARKPQPGAIGDSSLRARLLLELLFQNQIESDDFGAALDSLARNYPSIRNPLLEELLIPRTPVFGLPQILSNEFLRDEFHQYQRRLSPLERMSLNGERYAPYSLAPTALDRINQRLEKDSKFTPFERMSLIARRYAIYHSSDKSLKSYQLDIRRTLQWWFEEVLK